MTDLLSPAGDITPSQLVNTLLKSGEVPKVTAGIFLDIMQAFGKTCSSCRWVDTPKRRGYVTPAYDACYVCCRGNTVQLMRRDVHRHSCFRHEPGRCTNHTV